MTVIAKVWGCTQLPELAKRQGHTQVNIQENTCFSVSLTWQVRRFNSPHLSLNRLLLLGNWRNSGPGSEKC